MHLAPPWSVAAILLGALSQPLANPPLAIAQELAAKRGEPGWRVLEAIEDVTTTLRRLVDIDTAPSIEEDAERPSLATLGSLAQFVSCVQLDYDTIGSRLDDLSRIRDAIGLDDSFAKAGEGGDA